jgi:hypothetical protein
MTSGASGQCGYESRRSPTRRPLATIAWTTDSTRPVPTCSRTNRHHGNTPRSRPECTRSCSYTGRSRRRLYLPGPNSPCFDRQLRPHPHCGRSSHDRQLRLGLRSSNRDRRHQLHRTGRRPDPSSTFRRTSLRRQEDSRAVASDSSSTTSTTPRSATWDRACRSSCLGCRLDTRTTRAARARTLRP